MTKHLQTCEKLQFLKSLLHLFKYFSDRQTFSFLSTSLQRKKKKHTLFTYIVFSAPWAFGCASHSCVSIQHHCPIEVDPNQWEPNPFLSVEVKVQNLSQNSWEGMSIALPQGPSENPSESPRPEP